MSLSFLAFILMTAGLSPWISPYNPLDIDLSRAYESPSFKYWFGLDANGGDLFSQVLNGARISLGLSTMVVFICVSVGLIIGSLSAWTGGLTDQILMRVVDMLSSFPRFLTALAIIAFLGSSLWHLIMALSLFGWTGFARLARGEILHLKKEEYVLNARALGVPSWQILVQHIWPNLFGLLAVQASFSIAGVAVAEAGLSFLGLGLAVDSPSLGRLLSAGRMVLAEAPHLCFFAGLALFFIILSFQFFGEALRDFFDPKGIK